MQLVRNELLGSRVFVFAPQGRILNLAKGATLADAVAHIVADEASWGGGMGEDYLALVNAVEEPRDYGLRNGDIVSFAPRGDDLAEEMPEEALVGGAEAVAWPLCSFCRPLPGDTVLGCAAQHSRRGTARRPSGTRPPVLASFKRTTWSCLLPRPSRGRRRRCRGAAAIELGRSSILRPALGISTWHPAAGPRPAPDDATANPSARQRRCTARIATARSCDGSWKGPARGWSTARRSR